MLNYLNHNFSSYYQSYVKIFKFTNKDKNYIISFYYCDKCHIRCFNRENDSSWYYWDDSKTSYQLLKLTCDEMIISNITG